MKTILLFLHFLLFWTSLMAQQFLNVPISSNNAPEEPSIIINPKNTSQMVAGSNIDNYYYSNDGGNNWIENTLNSSYGVWGDPCLQVDTAGNFYFFHLANPPYPGNWIDRIVCQKSTDGGATYDNGSFMGLNGNKAQDKEWAAVDRTNNHIYIAWTQFDSYGSTSPYDSSIIRFSKSINGGQSWSTPKRINRVAGDCLDEDNTVEGAVPAIGPNGEIYVSWAGPLGLVFNRSLDGGTTWLDTNIFISDIPGGWDYKIPAIYRANGLPITCCDLSQGSYRGNIYVNWSDQRNGLTDTDIWFIKSTDGGLTWSERKRVNDDPPGKQQFFTWMTVDQATGYIYFVFYDRRNYTDNRTDVYMAVSRDGGETFSNFKISESPFMPFSSIFFGDYTNISAYNNIVRPIWARLDGANLSVYTAIIDSLFTGIPEKNSSQLPISIEQNYPNPGKEDTYISYKVHHPVRASLKVVDLFGRTIAVLFENKMISPGKYIEHFDVSTHQLSPGMYYFSLETGETSIRKKMILE